MLAEEHSRFGMEEGIKERDNEDGRMPSCFEGEGRGCEISSGRRASRGPRANKGKEKLDRFNGIAFNLVKGNKG